MARAARVRLARAFTLFGLANLSLVRRRLVPPGWMHLTPPSAATAFAVAPRGRRRGLPIHQGLPCLVSANDAAQPPVAELPWWGGWFPWSGGQ